jgi:NADH-ubiquinone oxidoreductase chain 3
MTLFILIVCVIAVLFLVINFLFAPHSPYKEKNSIFECGFHSFLGQNRSQFEILFFIYCYLFILFEADIMLIYPLAVSAYANDIYGLLVTLIFIGIVTIGFVFELGKGALKIDSRQNIKGNNINSINVTYLGYNTVTKRGYQ